MEFTTANSIDRCRRLMLGRASQIPVLADTVVIIDPAQGQNSTFAVRRVWKGMNGLLQYTVMEAVGTLTTTPERQTVVSSHIRVKIMGFVSIAFMLLFFLIAISDPKGSGIGIVLGIVLLGLLLLDWYILYRIVDELKT
jgi:hypothetical protein